MALPANRRVVAHATSATLSRALNTTSGQYDLGAVHTNRGAAAAITLTIPPGEIGDLYFFDVPAAHALNVWQDANVVFELGGTAYTAGYYLQNSGTAGETLEIVCAAANTWTVRNPVGSHWSVGVAAAT